MADLACWKDDRLVDSAALYGAFSHLMSKYPRAFDALGLAMLYCIVHKAPAGWSQPSGGPDLRKDCDQTDCRRCALQLGGYSFRWCHSLWEDGYQRSRNSASLDLRGKCPGTPSGGYMLLHLCIQRDQDLPDYLKAWRITCLFQQQPFFHRQMRRTVTTVWKNHIDYSGDFSCREG